MLVREHHEWGDSKIDGESSAPLHIPLSAYPCLSRHNNLIDAYRKVVPFCDCCRSNIRKSGQEGAEHQLSLSQLHYFQILNYQTFHLAPLFCCSQRSLAGRGCPLSRSG